MALPSKLLAGDAWTFEHIEPVARPLAELRIHINGPVFTYTSDPITSTDGIYRFEFSNAVSRTFAPSQYAVAITALEDGKRRTILTGHMLTVEPDPATASSFSPARRRLFLLEALYEGRISASDAIFSELSINGRTVKKASMAEVRTEIEVARRDVEKEERNEKTGAGPLNKNQFVRIRFKSAI